MDENLDGYPSTKLVRFAAGDHLFREGDNGREMYILRSGRVRVSISKEGRSVPITELGKGCHVGEMSFIAAIPRTATVTALEPVLANRISPDVLADDVFSVSGWAISIARVLVERIKRTTDLLGDYLSAGPHPVSAEATAERAEEHVPFAVESRGADGVLRLRGILDKERLSELKAAIRKTLIKGPDGVVIDFSGIIDIDMEALSFLLKLAQSGQARAGKIQLRNMQLIRNKVAGMKEIKGLIDAAKLPARRVEAGAYLIRQGERERSMFVVASGEFEVIEERAGAAPIVLERVQTGDVVGEMSLLREGERSASVRAAKSSSVFEIAPKDFYANVYAVPDWFMRILDGLVDRLRNTNELLAQVGAFESEPAAAAAAEGMPTPLGVQLDGTLPGVFRLTGTLNLANTECLAPMIRHCLYSGRKDITVDLRGVTRIDPESIRYLLNLYMVLKENGGTLTLSGNHAQLVWLKDMGGENSLAGLRGDGPPAIGAAPS